MNNTIPFHSAPHAPQITVDVNILTMLKQAASCLTEAAGRDVYLAAIGPDMELTIIMEEDAPSVLPCFDEDDALITVKGAPLFISYNPAQVLKLAGKRYLTGPVIFYRTDGHSTIVSLTVEDTIVTRRAMNGGQDLPIICKVYEGLTEEEEAMLFSRQTGVSTPLTAGAELRAALVGKDPESLAFVKATESTGLQIGLDSYRAPWKIICIRTAFKEYKAYGADLYKEALTMLAKGWEGDPDSLRSGILQGMVRFVALYQGEYDPERLVKRLHTVHPMTLVNDEKSLSGTVSYKYMMLILRTYNGASRRFNLPIKQ